MNKNELIALINSKIKQNESGEITAQVLNSILIGIVEFAASASSQNDFYTKSQVDSLISGHTHSQYALTSHTHSLPTASTTGYGIVNLNKITAETSNMLNSRLASYSLTSHTHSQYATTGMVNTATANTLSSAMTSVNSLLNSQYATTASVRTSMNSAISTCQTIVQAATSNCLTQATAKTQELINIAITSHTHDDRYYTESEVDTLLDGKADVNHTHGDQGTTIDCYTKEQVDTLLAGKAGTGHTHANYVTSPMVSSITSTMTQSLLNERLQQYSLTGHTHSQYALSGHTHPTYTASTTGYGVVSLNLITSTTNNMLNSRLSSYATIGHTHTAYTTPQQVTAITTAFTYNKQQIDAKISGHTHDDRYYTKSEIDNMQPGGQVEPSGETANSWIRLSEYNGTGRTTVQMSWDENTGYTRFATFTYNEHYKSSAGNVFDGSIGYVLVQEGPLGDDGNTPSEIWQEVQDGIDSLANINNNDDPNYNFRLQTTVLSTESGSQTMRAGGEWFEGNWLASVTPVYDWTPYMPNDGNTEILTPDPEPTQNSGETQEQYGEYDPRGHNWLELPLMNDSGLTYGFHTYGQMDRSYSYGYSKNDYLSKWVAYPLNSQYIGSGTRSNAWGYDPLISANYQADVSGNYNNGYVRSQLIPSGNRLNYSANVQTFYSTNIIPLKYEIDEVLGSIDQKIKQIAQTKNMSYVVAGTIFNENSTTTTDKSGKTVKVPDYVYRVMLVENQSQYSFYCAKVDANTGEVSTPSVYTLENTSGMCFFPNLKNIVGENSYNQLKNSQSGSLIE